MNRDQHPIVNIEILGDCKDLNECEHFCIFTFSDDTFKTVQLKGKDIVDCYWNILTAKQKKHLEPIYYCNNIKKIEILPICKQTYPCRHECILTYNNGLITKESYNGSEIISKFWEFLNDKDKLHFKYLYTFNEENETVTKIEIQPSKCINPIKNCHHKCCLYYQSGKIKNEILSGCEIIHNYWNILSDLYKLHFGLLIDNHNNKDKVYKIQINKMCHQTTPCTHLCTLYYYDYKKEISLNASEIIEKYWNILSDYDKNHFAKYR